MNARSVTAVGAAVAALAAAGCGGDDEKADRSTPAGTASAETAAPVPTATGPATPSDTKTTTAPGDDPSQTGTQTSGEDQPGGAGDEVPNTTQALITGRGGKLSPATVSVPPFIAITVELRSGDGLDYRLRGGGRTLSAGEGRNSATATFDGLRPGRSLRLTGARGTITVTANAEPGP